MHETAGTVARGDGGKRCVVTILFTDIEGFAGVTEDLGDERAHALLRVHNAKMLCTEAFEHAAHECGFALAHESRVNVGAVHALRS